MEENLIGQHNRGRSLLIKKILSNNKVSQVEYEANESQDQVKSDPILFARTETIHVPVQLKKLQRTRYSHKSVIYQTDKDGKVIQAEQPMIAVSQSQEKGFKKWLRSLFRCCISKSDIEEPHNEITNYVDDIPVAPFLKEKSKTYQNKKTLVLDLDETLVHSSFKPVPDADHIVDVEIEKNIYHVFVYRRPGAIEFIKKMSQYFEVVIYTASLKKYAYPLLNQMDTDHILCGRLFRDHCVQAGGIFVKDLGLLGRDLTSTIIVDNSAASFQFHPMNGIECTSFIDDKSDKELNYLEPFLIYLSGTQGDIRNYTHEWPAWRQKAINREYNLAPIQEELEIL
ncbi:hypothetical protein WA158_003837 [Blastocystis sp. Blastoise]